MSEEKRCVREQAAAAAVPRASPCAALAVADIVVRWLPTELEGAGFMFACGEAGAIWEALLLCGACRCVGLLGCETTG